MKFKKKLADKIISYFLVEASKPTNSDMMSQKKNCLLTKKKLNQSSSSSFSASIFLLHHCHQSFFFNFERVFLLGMCLCVCFFSLESLIFVGDFLGVEVCIRHIAWLSWVFFLGIFTFIIPFRKIVVVVIVI